MPHNKLLQYQSITKPVFVPPFSGGWFSPLSEPVRKKISDALAVALIASGVTFVPVIAATPSGPASAAEGSPVTYEIFDKRAIIYPAFQGPTPIAAETVTSDKWSYHWSEPVRHKRDPRLSVALAASGGVPDPLPIPNVFGTGISASPSVVFEIFDKRPIIYQASAAPVFVTTETITEDKWHQPLSIPVRIKPRLITGAQQFLAFDPFPLPSVSGTGVVAAPPVAFEIFSRATIIYPAYQGPIRFAVETITEDKWHQAWSTPVRIRPRLTTGAQQAFFAPVRPTVSFGWNEHSSWSDPVRTKPRLTTGAQQAFTAPSRIITPFGWNEPLSWSDPPKPKIDPRHAIALIASGPVLYPFPFPPVAFTEASWHEPWSDPVRIKRGLSASLQQAFTTSPYPVEQIFEDKWHRPLSEPVRTRPRLITGAQQFLAFNPRPIVSFGWNEHSSWAEPVRTRAALRSDLQQAVAFPLRTLEEITEDKWHQPWSQPVRIKQGLISAAQRYLEFDPFPIPRTGETTEASWHFPWSEPVRFKIDPKAAISLAASSGNSLDPFPLPAATGTAPASIETAVSFRILGIRRIIYPAYQAPVPIVTETITEDKWHQAWSEPVRIKRGLLAGQQQTLTIPPPEKITEDKWHFAWSEPVRQKRDPRAAIALIASGVVLNPLPYPALEPTWHFPWSEPVRLRRGLSASQQLPSAIPAPERITEDKWHQAWSEPVRLRRGLLASQQQAAIVIPRIEVITLDKWYEAWSEPVRIRKGLLASEQQFFTSALGTIETITEDKWHQAWSEPVRLKPRLITGAQQYLALYSLPLPALESGWHEPWSEPVRVRINRQRAVALISSGGVINPLPIPTVLPAAESPITFEIFTRHTLIYPSYQAPIRVAPIVIVPEDRWHQPWSEPIWLRVGPPRLPVYLQQTTTLPPRILTGGLITGTLDATEAGDIFFALGHIFNQVAGANVGIVELVPVSARVGLQFDKPTVSANVGNKTDIQSNQSGTVVGPAVSAIVSIRSV